jgi:hypothetical protein
MSGKRYNDRSRHQVSIGLLFILLSLNAVRTAYGEDQTNQDKVKAEIISIQKQVVDLTNPLEPLFDKQFVAMRKSMSVGTAKKIVELIESGSLAPMQSDIAVLLLSGLDQQIYWHFTESLLSTNIDGDTLDDLLSPPFPYGPGYANAFRFKEYKDKLLALKEKRPDQNLDLILSGEASRTYLDYLKHPEKYGY